MAKKRVLSGIRATGRLHLGNYLGAVKGMLALQSDPTYETFYMVADLHTLTTPYSPKDLKKNAREVVLDYLAAGLDPEKSTIFIQSHVPEHVELAYLFSTAVSIARMQHLPTYKEKVKQFPQNNTMALLYYPVLMAADILAYKASDVPVGIDQEPHLEVAREIARKMNEKYGLDFPEPKSIRSQGEYVPSLTGEGKMSKSVEGSYINLTDDLETIRRKIFSIPTATKAGGEMSAGIKILFRLMELFITKKEDSVKIGRMLKEFDDGTLQFEKLKDYVAELIFGALEPIQIKRAKFEKDPAYVDRVLEEGAKRARAVARETLDQVKQAMGLI